jgi:hypothetical protein
MKNLFLTTLVLSAFVFSYQEQDDMKHGMHKEDHMDHMDHMDHHAPAPIATTGNMHHNGWMVSVKHGLMHMSGNIMDGDSISNADILQMPNAMGSMPANLSVIPNDMDMQMTMIDVMYAPSKDITLMMMGTYISKDMTLKTYSGMMSRELLGKFSTSSSDISDLTFSALYSLHNENNSKWHGELSVQKSIGKNDDTDQVLTPMGTEMNMVLPYAMQSSDKATRLILGLTNTRKLNDKTSWTNQGRYKKVVNKKDWAFGDQFELNSWIQYQYKPYLSLSTRLKFVSQDAISGINPMIMAPVQTANPKNYGGEELHIGFGASHPLSLFGINNQNIGVELMLPLLQEKNNLQMKLAYQVTFGYQKAF